MAAAQERLAGVPQLPARQVSQIAAGAAVSTISLDAASMFVALTASTAAAFFILAASSTGSTATGSTGFIPPNKQVMRGVRGLSKLFVWST